MPRNKNRKSNQFLYDFGYSKTKSDNKNLFCEDEVTLESTSEGKDVDCFTSGETLFSLSPSNNSKDKSTVNIKVTIFDDDEEDLSTMVPSSDATPGQKQTVACKSNSKYVRFIDVQNNYTIDEDLPLLLELSGNFKPGKKDWVGLFPRKWNDLNEYGTYQFVPSVQSKRSPLGRRIIFPSTDLVGVPTKNIFYQFVYVSETKEVLGCSKSFHLTTTLDLDFTFMADSDSPAVVSLKTKPIRRNTVQKETCRNTCRWATQTHKEPFQEAAHTMTKTSAAAAGSRRHQQAPQPQSKPKVPPIQTTAVLFDSTDKDLFACNSSGIAFSHLAQIFSSLKPMVDNGYPWDEAMSKAIPLPPPPGHEIEREKPVAADENKKDGGPEKKRILRIGAKDITTSSAFRLASKPLPTSLSPEKAKPLPPVKATKDDDTQSVASTKGVEKSARGSVKKTPRNTCIAAPLSDPKKAKVKTSVQSDIQDLRPKARVNTLVKQKSQEHQICSGSTLIVYPKDEKLARYSPTALAVLAQRESKELATPSSIILSQVAAQSCDKCVALEMAFDQASRINEIMNQAIKRMESDKNLHVHELTNRIDQLISINQDLKSDKESLSSRVSDLSNKMTTGGSIFNDKSVMEKQIIDLNWEKAGLVAKIKSLADLLEIKRHECEILEAEVDNTRNQLNTVHAEIGHGETFLRDLLHTLSLHGYTAVTDPMTKKVTPLTSIDEASVLVLQRKKSLSCGISKSCVQSSPSSSNTQWYKAMLRQQQDLIQRLETGIDKLKSDQLHKPFKSMESIYGSEADEDSGRDLLNALGVAGTDSGQPGFENQLGFLIAKVLMDERLSPIINSIMSWFEESKRKTQPTTSRSSQSPTRRTWYGQNSQNSMIVHSVWKTGKPPQWPNSEPVSKTTVGPPHIHQPHSIPSSRNPSYFYPNPNPDYTTPRPSCCHSLHQNTQAHHPAASTCQIEKKLKFHSEVVNNISGFTHNVNAHHSSPVDHGGVSPCKRKRKAADPKAPGVSYSHPSPPPTSCPFCFQVFAPIMTAEKRLAHIARHHPMK